MQAGSRGLRSCLCWVLAPAVALELACGPHTHQLAQGGAVPQRLEELCTAVSRRGCPHASRCLPSVRLPPAVGRVCAGAGAAVPPDIALPHLEPLPGAGQLVLVAGSPRLCARLSLQVQLCSQACQPLRACQPVLARHKPRHRTPPESGFGSPAERESLPLSPRCRWRSAACSCGTMSTSCSWWRSTGRRCVAGCLRWRAEGGCCVAGVCLDCSWPQCSRA